MRVCDFFAARVNVEPSGCWGWTGGKAGAGYAVLRVDGVQTYAHRWSYEWHVAPIPEGMEIDHLCRNKACVNPHHLEPVSHAENRKRARLDRCHRGHDLRVTVHTNPNGSRICRECDKLRRREYRARAKAVA